MVFLVVNDFRLFILRVVLIWGASGKKEGSYKMKKFMTKLALTVGAVCGSASSVLAEGEYALDMTQLTLAQTGISTGIKGIFTGALPVVGAVMLAGLGIWGLFLIVGLIKKAGNKAKS